MQLIKNKGVLILFFGVLLVLPLFLTGCIPEPTPIDELEDDLIEDRPEEIDEIVDEARGDWDDADYRELMDLSDWIKEEASFPDSGRYNWVYYFTDHAQEFVKMNELELSNVILTALHKEMEGEGKGEGEGEGEEATYMDYLRGVMIEEELVHEAWNLYPQLIPPYDYGFSYIPDYLQILGKELGLMISAKIIPAIAPQVGLPAVAILKVYGVYDTFNTADVLADRVAYEYYVRALLRYFSDREGIAADWEKTVRQALDLEQADLSDEEQEQLIQETGELFNDLYQGYNEFRDDSFNAYRTGLDREKVRRSVAEMIGVRLQEEYLED